MPCSICRACKEQLTNAYFFKQRCEKSDKSFRDIINREKQVKQEAQLNSEAESANILDDINLLINSEQSNQNNVKRDPDASLLRDSSDNCDFIEFLENNQQILTCRVCYKVFTTVEGLRCHKRLHTGAMFKCKVCDKEYTRQNHLQRHELTHGKRKVHVCKICNKTLTRFEHLKRHLTIHLKEKPFQCNICNRGFNRQEHLMNHVKRCKGDRIYICDICNKAFNREDSLELHKHVHDNKMPILPTLENLDNIDEHYYEIDYDGNTTFSDNSDNEVEVEDCFEPQISINVSENSVQAETSIQEENADAESETHEANDDRESHGSHEDDKADESIKKEELDIPCEFNEGK